MISARFPDRCSYPYAPAGAGNKSRVSLMGVVNLTPDSFYDGGRYTDTNAAVDRCRQCIEEGADIVDLGAESTRPGSQGVEAAAQLDRLRPVIRALRQATGVTVSVDTSDPEVMLACLSEGAQLINDVCALERAGAMEVVSGFQCAVCLMHKQGAPASMQDNPVYDDVVRRVRRYLFGRVAACIGAGIAVERLMIDPGFGFGKNFAHNYALLSGLADLRFGGLPLVVGLSRKSMIGYALGDAERDDTARRLEGSLIASAYAVWRGADVVRTHDVASTRRALQAALTIARFHR